MFLRASVQKVALSLLILPASAQLTLTGCHLQNGAEICFLPGGVETTVSTATAPITASPTQSTDTAQTTAITDCHQHGTTQYCVRGDGGEVQVMATATGSQALPTAYSDCHSHGTDTYCVSPDGTEVEVLAPGAEAGDEDDSGSSGDASEENCHFHAGVEHCVGGLESAASPASCERRDRDYDVNLRIGLLFVILATSGIGVYAPLILRRLLKVDATGLVFTGIKQFGTGIIISTALIHLLTHAELMFGNSCLGELKYEATATSIAMAGAFLAFLVDYMAHRLAHWRRSKSEMVREDVTDNNSSAKGGSNEVGQTAHPLAALAHHHGHHGASAHANDAISVFVLEAGIIFHSLLIGITLVVAGDSVFITLFIVIIFHQMFEGLALGARIAAIDTLAAGRLKKTRLFILPLAFALVTPIGMAIGIGVLNSFNGNDPSTIVALGTLDSLSAGILLWVGLVDMWAGDWIYGELRLAGLVKTIVATVSLIAGMVLMGVLGKWA